MPQLDHCGVGEEGELRFVKCLPEESNMFRGMHGFIGGIYLWADTGWSVFGVRMATQAHLMVLSLWLAFEPVSEWVKAYT